MDSQHDDKILLPQSLTGVSLGVSVSDSPDLGRLGLVEAHLRLALGEVTRAVLLSGARMVYGGRLDLTGYTAFLQSELEKYGRRDRPLLVCLAWHEHRGIRLSDLAAAEESLGLYGKIIYLDSGGRPINRDVERGDAAEVVDPREHTPALTGLRQYLTSETDARLLIGGRINGFDGRMPGLLEEALSAVQSDQPLYLAGGFGGITNKIATQFGLDPEVWLVPRTDAPAEDSRVIAGLQELIAAAVARDWTPEKNGLSRKENLKLAASHRPSDVASLVATGLRRLHPA